MNSPGLDDAGEQSHLDRGFADTATWWDEAYGGNDVLGAVLKRRSDLALELTERIGLLPLAASLDVGCGAGQMAVSLAESGLRVWAVDRVPLMVELTRARADDSNFAATVSAQIGDVHGLDFENAYFKLAVALGVIDWVHSPDQAIAELARVIEPGGWLIVSCAHPTSIVFLLDPLNNHYLNPVRLGVKRALVAWGLRRYRAHTARKLMLKRRELDHLLTSAGFERIDWRTVGFGPFSIFGRRLLPNAWGLKINELLQSLADAGTPVIKSAGMGYLVLARRTGMPPEPQLR